MTYALTFPGQGSQSIGMLDALLGTHASIVNDTFAESSDAIGMDLLALCTQGPAEKINQTAITQPLMLCADIAVWRVLQSEGCAPPAILAGHSLGEYAALVVAQSLSLSDATQVVQHRGQLMQQAVPQDIAGVAAILGLDDQLVIDVCNELSDEEIVCAVNFNAAGQVVIAGHKNKVEQAIEALKKANAKRALMLPLSVPVHSPLLEPVGQEFAEKLEQYTLQMPNIPVIHNIDCKEKNSVVDIKQALTAQIYNPVHWVQCLNAVLQHSTNCDIIAECGPGKVLFGLNRRINKEAKHFSLFDQPSIQQFIDYLNKS